MPPPVKRYLSCFSSAMYVLLWQAGSSRDGKVTKATHLLSWIHFVIAVAVYSKCDRCIGVRTFIVFVYSACTIRSPMLSWNADTEESSLRRGCPGGLHWKRG